MAYTPEQHRQINTLLSTIKNRTVPMAVVDYLGKQKQDFGSNELRFVTITEDDPERFGVRDLRHVEIYRLKVVVLNEAAERKWHGDDPMGDYHGRNK